MTNHTDLIARLREVEAEQRKVAHGMDMDPKKTINWEHAETINAGIAALEAARAYVARLAELEKQEPVIYQAKTKPGFLSTSAYAWEDCEKADFLVYEADGVHVRGLYAAAGASPVEPSESVEHRDELAKRKPEPAAETVGGLAEAVKAARGGDAPPAPMRGFA